MTHWKDRLLEADRELVREMSPGEVPWRLAAP